MHQLQRQPRISTNASCPAIRHSLDIDMKKAEAVRRPRPAIREFTRFLGAALLGTALPFAADAQVIDNIEVRRVGDEAEVVIRFNTPIQYQRHSPPTRGEIVNLYFQFLALDGTESVLTREQRSVPRSELLEALVATYPEPNSAMSIRFGSVTNYRVPQGEGADRVRDRRARLAAAPVAEAPAAPARPHRETPEGWVTTGSLAQYRYYGQSASNVDPVIVTVNNAGQQFQQQQVNAQ